MIRATIDSRWVHTAEGHTQAESPRSKGPEESKVDRGGWEETINATGSEVDASHKSMVMYRERPASLKDPNKQERHNNRNQCQGAQDMDRQVAGEEVCVATMGTSGLSATTVHVTPQGDHEGRMTAKKKRVFS